MKKIIFSAIALVAFAGSSMANTIETNKLEKLDVKEIEQSQFPCSDSYKSNVSLLVYVGMSETSAREVAQKVFDKCLSETYK